MSGKASGQVAIRRRRGSTRYALRLATAGKRHHLALGGDHDDLLSRETRCARGHGGIDPAFALAS